MRIRKMLKGSLISLAVLGMIGGSININNVNASRRRYRAHRVYRHRARKVNYKFGYWKHHHYYRYKTGYFRNGKWIRKSYRHNAHRINHRNHKVYRFMGRTYHNERDYDIALYNSAVFGNPDGVVKHHRNRRIKRNKYANKKLVRHTHAKKVRHNKVTKQSIDNSFNPNNPTFINRNLAEMKQQTLIDINNDRQANGVAPLTETPELDQLANTRAVQVQTNFNHVDGDYGENLTETRYGNTEIQDGTPITNNNGYDMANNEENAMMNHDAHSNNGHRQNILDPTSTQIGIGASYNNEQPDYYPYKLVEDFK